MRSALVGEIYKKSLKQDAKSKRDGSIGGMVNLMSVDCETINGLMGKFPFLKPSSEHPSMHPRLSGPGVLDFKIET